MKDLHLRQQREISALEDEISVLKDEIEDLKEQLSNIEDEYDQHQIKMEINDKELAIHAVRFSMKSISLKWAMKKMIGKKNH